MFLLQGCDFHDAGISFLADAAALENERDAHTTVLTSRLLRGQLLCSPRLRRGQLVRSPRLRHGLLTPKHPKSSTFFLCSWQRVSTCFSWDALEPACSSFKVAASFCEAARSLSSLWTLSSKFFFSMRAAVAALMMVENGLSIAGGLSVSTSSVEVMLAVSDLSLPRVIISEGGSAGPLRFGNATKSSQV